MKRDSEAEPDIADYKTAMMIMGDLDGISAWSAPAIIAQWVATIRRYERAICLAEECENRRTIG